MYASKGLGQSMAYQGYSVQVCVEYYNVNSQGLSIPNTGFVHWWIV